MDAISKYYILQVLQLQDDTTQYYLWCRWGRNKNNGQNSLANFKSLDAVVSAFNKKFKDKTKNDFMQPFVAVKGKFILDRDLSYNNTINLNDEVEKQVTKKRKH